jgi:hypothetical protein
VKDKILKPMISLITNIRIAVERALEPVADFKDRLPISLDRQACDLIHQSFTSKMSTLASALVSPGETATNSRLSSGTSNAVLAPGALGTFARRA